MREILIWALLAIAVAVPPILALNSPLLAWRDPIYIAAGIAGVLAMLALLVQPLLAMGHLPGLSEMRGRRVHRWTGAVLVAAILAHVVGLWITSPPDVIDVLLFASPTPFSVWGVLAMWAVFASALLAALRRRLRLAPRMWRLMHTSLAIIIVLGSVVHAMLIEGTMEILSKTALCALVLIATTKAVAGVWAKVFRTAR